LPDDDGLYGLAIMIYEIDVRECIRMDYLVKWSESKCFVTSWKNNHYQIYIPCTSQHSTRISIDRSIDICLNTVLEIVYPLYEKTNTKIGCLKVAGYFWNKWLPYNYREPQYNLSGHHHHFQCITLIMLYYKCNTL